MTNTSDTDKGPQSAWTAVVLGIGLMLLGGVFYGVALDSYSVPPPLLVLGVLCLSAGAVAFNLGALFLIIRAAIISAKKALP
ncbi:hypothetical protein [Agromyces mangrovi Wang et al. 2018]|uniref:hypothetical protein n=1 Tax=Agromyces mangrovi TaxID=1858653 RepID=UPI002572A210|nr:hypothetical protein [Agromyces mangrovi]BDZ64115.1 hypothetical protein GCM10025877_10530 [Agromyces mangrovi]